MGNSLQDQLLKSGLGNRKQAAKARKASLGKRKKQAAGETVTDATEEQARKAQQEKTERDRELNRIKQEEADARAIAAQIKQLVEHSRVEERGEIQYSFTHGTRIKSIDVTTALRRSLVAGSLAIVHSNDRYELVPRPIADKIAERDPDCVVFNASAAETAKQADTEADGSPAEPEVDEYADFPVPDDLMW